MSHLRKCQRKQHEQKYRGTTIQWFIISEQMVSSLRKIMWAEILLSHIINNR